MPAPVQREQKHTLTAQTRQHMWWEHWLVQTLKERTKLTKSEDGSLLSVLSNRQLHVEKRNATEYQHDEVRNEKCTCINTTRLTSCMKCLLIHNMQYMMTSHAHTSATWVAQIWKTPQVSESNSVSNGCQHKLQFLVPCLTFYLYKIIPCYNNSSIRNKTGLTNFFSHRNKLTFCDADLTNNDTHTHIH